MRSRALTTLSLLLPAALAVASCGGGGDGGSSDTVPANAVVIKAIEGIAWDSKTYTAQSTGGQVTLSLKDQSNLPHNLHLLDKDNVDMGVALDVTGNGDVHTETVTLAPGTYQVICTIAGHGNMKATLTVN
jgi:plastocyanin